MVDDAARGVNVSAGKRVVESVDAGALEARNAEALIADGAQDYEAFTQLELFDTDLAEAALVSGQANARDALEISAGRLRWSEAVLLLTLCRTSCLGCLKIQKQRL